MTIKKVWIEEGCISCNLCQDLVPEVFLVKDGEVCVIRPDATSAFAARDAEIRQAAQDCPVEVIKLQD
ncbi:MAG: ferredoxin [Planctomycetes bacterium]|nr:ferredoxin [Planctomycetota bacterium]